MKSEPLTELRLKLRKPQFLVRIPSPSLSSFEIQNIYNRYRIYINAEGILIFSVRQEHVNKISDNLKEVSAENFLRDVRMLNLQTSVGEWMRKPQPGLADAAAHFILEKPILLSKSETLSNWCAMRLRWDQILYAQMDVISMASIWAERCQSISEGPLMTDRERKEHRMVVRHMAEFSKLKEKHAEEMRTLMCAQEREMAEIWLHHQHNLLHPSVHSPASFHPFIQNSPPCTNKLLSPCSSHSAASFHPYIFVYT